MIDIHNHIISGVDDGPQNEEQVLALLKQAAKENITGIVATPHHLHYRYNNKFNDIEQCVIDINNNEKVKELGVKIYPGQEVRASDKLLTDIDNGNIKGVNYSKYLLIELPSNQVPNFLSSLIYEIQTRGYIPVIVHPERNKVIAQDINVLYGLVCHGVLAQLTASSLSGDMGRNLQRISMNMIEYNLVHFIASDAHNTQSRPFLGNSLFSNSKLKKYEDEISMLYKNNEKMIQNKNINQSRPIEFKKKKFLGLF
ncbi:tyrosine-protein phosphatase [Staphylococcus simulans]|uniref:tyrosine-protein phosphatase n=1 Tax=Staphylococcus simulans TaxID=1286 RepID=UPI000D03C5FC|nr:CpsB/CapC family capsule biosynthesis tyrosine phosphatase [Staphylococcus simulans]